MSHLVSQNNILRKLKSIGSVINYPTRKDKTGYDLSVLAFADASKPNEYGKIGILIDLLVGPLNNGSIYHVITWILISQNNRSRLCHRLKYLGQEKQ